MSSACRLSVTAIYENGIGFNYAYQVATTAETRTPNLHRAKIAQQKSADERMVTEAAQLKGKKPTGGKRENRLDTNRPSHERTWPLVDAKPTIGCEEHPVCLAEPRKKGPALSLVLCDFGVE